MKKAEMILKVITLGLREFSCAMSLVGDYVGTPQRREPPGHSPQSIGLIVMAKAPRKTNGDC